MSEIVTLRRLQHKNIERQKEWDPTNAITIEYRGNELAGEVGELCNLIKKRARERLGLRGSRANDEDIKKEIGDVAVCLTLIANQMGFDLEDCVRFAFNETSMKYNLRTTL